MKTLHAISYSPWSEKARWALDHHKIDYREVAFTPPFDEVKLRFRTRNWTGRISAPLLTDGARAFTDSWDIAKYAEAIGSGETLFPEKHMAGIERLNDLSQRGLDAARAMVLAQVLVSDDALRDMAPARLGKLLGPLTPRITAAVIRKTLRKWGSAARTSEETLATCAETLAALRKELGGRQYLFDRFSYGDITASQLLGMVKPVTHPRLRIKAGARARFTIQPLVEQYGDLVEWRDELYARHRLP